MRRPECTLDRIHRLAEQEASGELICTSDAFEIHVFLQRGRIAWATSSTRPLEFTRYLLRTASIDVEVFREILESCRREKRPLGETLIAWGVATREEVRAALRHQVRCALAAIDDEAGIESLFLRRSAQYADYDVELTFELAEVVNAPDDAPAASSVRTSRAPLPSSVPPPSEALVHLQTALDGLVWSEEVRSATAHAALHGRGASRVSAELLRNTVLDGARLVTMCASKRTLAAVALGGERSLWCVIDGSSTLGTITAALSAMSSLPVDEPTLAPSADRSRFGQATLHTSAVLEDFLDRAADVRAIFLTDPRDPTATFGIARGLATAEPLASVVNRRGLAFASRAAPRDSSPPLEADAEGTTSFRAMSIESNCTLFATEIVVGGTALLAWIALETRGSKGLGWGYLTSLGRSLARVLRQEVA